MLGIFKVFLVYISTTRDRNCPAYATMCPSKRLRSDWTWRIRGVPLDWTKSCLQSFLNDWDSSSQPIIVSLACEIDGEFQTGTILFQNLSDEHKEDKNGCISLMKPGGGPFDDSAMALDYHFEGITTLHVPEPESHKVEYVPNRLREVTGTTFLTNRSVIAISGLGGHAFGSFKANGKAYMWLRDSLPKRLEIARIMVYGYKLDVANSTSSQTITDLAFDFRKTILPLAGTRRPTIIIAHSLGGLVVKQVRSSISQIFSGELTSYRP